MKTLEQVRRGAGVNAENELRTVVWFSCGITSAIAARIALEESKRPVTIAYCDTGSEHPDSVRFLRDCEKWFGHPIQILRSDRYADIWDVFEKTRWLIGPKGARCTTELKKLVRNAFERMSDLQVFGFDAAEGARALQFQENNPDVDLWTPLLEHGLTKENCLQMISDAG